MPPKASLNERIAWHLEHARACGCREIPASILAELERRGITPPMRATLARPSSQA
ncbi:hypothetical protein GGR25_001038 [Kaistia hirudinis]|uniref:Uncharacterized protein n=1 Tax=Kaistia hirudinis TaxID=1293440 RepID=A0A840AI23_9HYPH|nr:hypothetical protein [Kaistia hirudinis]MBB3929999.1 hypothetical protein [Kaistia hirudinis]